MTLSFVIPFYNEEKRISKTLQALQKKLFLSGIHLQELIFVNDGSRDNSKLKVQSSKLDIERRLGVKVKIISYVKNMGKGFAVKQGMLSSTSSYTLFFDADLSTPLSEVNKFIPLMKDGIDVIIGTRKNGKSTVVNHQPLFRELMGKGFTFIANTLFRTNFTDYTCGFKAFSREAKDKVFSLSRINRFGYDVEILYLTLKSGLSFKEVPVVWSNQKQSKVNILRDTIYTLKELVLIYFYHFDFKFPKLSYPSPATLPQPNSK